MNGMSKDQRLKPGQGDYGATARLFERIHVAGNHKENIDTQVTARQEGVAEVIDDDGNDGQCPEPVNLRTITSVFFTCCAGSPPALLLPPIPLHLLINFYVQGRSRQ